MEPIRRLRLIELALLIAAAAEVGMGQASGSSVRKALLSLHIASSMEWDEQTQADSVYTSLLRWAGCTSHGHEFFLLFDDEIEVHSSVIALDFSSRAPLFFIARHAGEGRGMTGRARTLLAAAVAGPSFTKAAFVASCEVAQLVARQMGISVGQIENLGYVFERWDGKGFPGATGASDIPAVVRLVHGVNDFSVFADVGDTTSAVEMLRRRSGTFFDPQFVDAVAAQAPPYYEEMQKADLHDLRQEIVDTEPGERPYLVDQEVDRGLAAVGQFSDLKNPFTLGQSQAAAARVSSVGQMAGWDEPSARYLNQVALCQALGRISMPSGIWERPGPFRPADWDRIHLYPFHGEQLLSMAGGLCSLADSVGQVQERLDGSGYYRRLKAPSIDHHTRVLQAAVAIEAMTRERPHRQALNADQILLEVDDEIDQGRLDRRSVSHVLEAGNMPPLPRARASASQLSERELEVLRLAAVGRSRKQIAVVLSISPHTVDTHLRHIYSRLGVTTRAAAALVAVQQGLL